MKLLFASFSPFPMDVGLPEREPLGGSESCVAYLARQLARNGHDVTLAARLPDGAPEWLQDVRHVSMETLNDPAFLKGADFDATIALSGPATAEHFKRRAPGALHISWLHLTPDQSAMAPLTAMTPYIDCAVFVSRTQRAMVRYDGVSAVIGNGIAPAFENMFATAEELRAAKKNRAAYTSMPYRGLHLLVKVIRQTRSKTHFDVYSAMHTYRKPDADFAGLYDQVKGAPATRYHGSLAQPVLARELKSAAFLAYPCAFVETYCITALEAMAAGLKVISTDLGALRETTLGFADLLPLTADMEDAEIVERYTALLEHNIAAFQADPEEWAAERFAQSQAVNRLCSWRARAAEWEMLLAQAILAKRGGKD